MRQDVVEVVQPRWIVQPKIVCLCGSTRFSREFQEANLQETLAGRIVLTIGCDLHSDKELFDNDPEVKDRLDWLHLRKIDLADEVLVINRGGYIGKSTREEIEYARMKGKPVRYLFPDEPKSGGITMSRDADAATPASAAGGV